MLRVLAGCLVAAWLLAALAPAARADDSGAAALFRAAESAYRRHDYKAAAVAFEEANRKDPRAATVYNAGLAWQSANEPARAADAFAAALALADLDEARKTDAQARLDTLEKTLGVVHVVAADARVTLEHQSRVPAPVVVHVAPGEHRVSIERADGAWADKRVTVAAAQRVEVSFDAAAPAPPAPPKPAPSAASPAAAPAVPPPVPAEPRSGSSTRTWGWLALGGAALASGAALVIGVSALDAKDEFEASENRDAEAHDRAARLRMLANVAWGGAAVLGVTGGVILVTSSGGGQPQAGLLVRGRF